MKKAICSGVLIAACSGLANAQSSVTLTGVVDLSLRSMRNSLGTVTSLSSGNNSTSRLVFRGTEDLGGGLKANFWLESSFNADTGTQGGAQFWDRQSTVSLSGPFGEVRMGRDWTPVYYGFVFADPWLNVGVGSGSNFLSATASTTYARAFANPALTTLSRSNNAIEYWLPQGMGGVYGNAMMSAGESSNAAGAYKYTALRLGWKGGSVDVAAYGSTTRIDASGDNLAQRGVFGSYDFGVATAMLSITNSDYRGSKQTHLMGGVRSVMGPWVLKASYNKLDQKGVDANGASIAANDASQFALGVDYLLSKRTAVYVNAARLGNKGAARFAIPIFTPIAPGSSSSGYEAGIRHSF